MAVSTGDSADHGVENNTWCLIMLHMVMVFDSVIFFFFFALVFTIFSCPPGSDLRNLRKKGGGVYLIPVLTLMHLQLPQTQR